MESISRMVHERLVVWDGDTADREGPVLWRGLNTRDKRRGACSYP